MDACELVIDSVVFSEFLNNLLISYIFWFVKMLTVHFPPISIFFFFFFSFPALEQIRVAID